MGFRPLCGGDLLCGEPSFKLSLRPLLTSHKKLFFYGLQFTIQQLTVYESLKHLKHGTVSLIKYN